ncbi:MAG TPA: hypothetical protein VNI60_00890, partial [Pyrinomonadaceae bacterium]|nr:hypothetical protein [Pyrinomonadaceae bacterium]
MPETNEQIERLQARLDKMVEYQDYFFREINLIQIEIGKLKAIPNEQNDILPLESQKKPPVDKDVSFYKPSPTAESYQSAKSSETKEKSTASEPNSQERQNNYSNYDA